MIKGLLYLGGLATIVESTIKLREIGKDMLLDRKKDIETQKITQKVSIEKVDATPINITNQEKSPDIPSFWEELLWGVKDNPVVQNTVIERKVNFDIQEPLVPIVVETKDKESQVTPILGESDNLLARVVDKVSNNIGAFWGNFDGVLTPYQDALEYIFAFTLLILIIMLVCIELLLIIQVLLLIKKVIKKVIELVTW